METLMLYLLKMLICSGILFGYYRLALYNERFHQWNRFYLLAAMLLSVVVPLISIPVFATENRGNVEVVIASMPWNVTLAHVPVQTALSWRDVMFLAIVTVSLTLLLKVVVNIARLFIIYKTNPVNKLADNVQLVFTQLKHAPFSFFNWLFWRQDIDPASNNGQRMLTHELTHIREHHSIDKIFTEVLLCMFWMNPFFWLMRRELGTVHEFLADRRAIGKQDGAAFAAMILHALHLQPASTNGLVNPFYSSQIKRRLQMITTSKEPKYSYLRRLSGLVLMICSAVVLTLSIQRVTAQDNKKSVEKKVSSNQVKQDTAHARQSLLKEDFNRLNQKRVVTKPGEVITLQADSITWKGAKGEAIGTTSSGEKVKVEISKQPTFGELPIKIFSQDTTSSTRLRLGDLKVEPLYILDEKEISSQEMKAINPNNIQSITVLKDGSSLNKYGEKGRHGVIIITSKNLTEVPIVSSGNDSIHKLTEIAVVGYGRPAGEYDKVFTKVEQPAQFPGGEAAWIKYLGRNLLYPEAALKAGTAGTARLRFIIDVKGNISNIKVLNDPGNGIGEEAVKLLSRGPKWQPAIQNGRLVNYQVELAIDFQIGKAL